VVKFLVDSFSFELVLPFNFKCHLKLELSLFLVNLELAQFELSTLFKVVLHFFELRFELDDLTVHVILSAVKVSNTPFVFIFNLDFVS
jgi:hypothetical protein